MNFVNVQNLYLIWLMPLLLALILLGVSRRRRILTRFSSRHGLRSIAPRVSEKRRWIKAGLLLAVVFMVLVALAGPRYGYRWQEIQRKGIDIVLTLDCSRSMLANDIRPSRLDRAKREVYDLLALLRGDRIGLVAFAGTAFLQSPLTIDYDAFYLFLNALTPDFLPVGGTNLEQAILKACDAFESTNDTDKAIILITDGEHTGSGDPLDAAAKARQAGIKIFCIGIGQTEGVPLIDAKGGFRKDRSGKIVLTRLDETVLKQIAAETGGTYVRSVAGDLDLDVIYSREIRGKMEAAELASGRKKIWQDRFQWPLLAAIILLLVELLIPSARRLAILAPLIIGITFSPQAMAGPWQEGMQAYREENFKQALEHFLQAQIDDPENPQILYNLGNTYYRLGDYQAALEHFQRAQDIAGDELRQQALYNGGNASYRNGMLKEALRQYLEALYIDPEDRLARENLEFVKALLEKQPRSGNKDNSDQDKSEQEETDRQQASDQQKNSSGQQTEEDQSHQPPQQPPERQAPPEGNKPEDGQDRGQQPQPQKDGQSAQDQGTASGRQDGRDGEEDVSQAERILNRLQDQPGRALIPFYDKKQVEKDW